MRIHRQNENRPTGRGVQPLLPGVGLGQEGLAGQEAGNSSCAQAARDHGGRGGFLHTVDGQVVQAAGGSEAGLQGGQDGADQRRQG